MTAACGRSRHTFPSSQKVLWDRTFLGGKLRIGTVTCLFPLSGLCVVLYLFS